MPKKKPPNECNVKFEPLKEPPPFDPIYRVLDFNTRTILLVTQDKSEVDRIVKRMPERCAVEAYAPAIAVDEDNIAHHIIIHYHAPPLPMA